MTQNQRIKALAAECANKIKSLTAEHETQIKEVYQEYQEKHQQLTANNQVDEASADRQQNSSTGF